MTPSRQWFITGANGYVGGELSMGLHLRSHATVAVARQARDLTRLQEIGLPATHYEQLPSRLSAGDVLVHCAGKTGSGGSWDEFVRVNRDWTLALFELASDCSVECFVYVSSVAALGYKNRPGGEPLDESSPPAHTKGEFYGRSKWAAEQALRDRARGTSTRLVILRPGLIYGRRPFGRSQTWLRRGTVVDASQRVPLVHIDSFVEAVIRLAEEPQARGVFLVVDEEQPTLRELNDLRLRSGILQFAPWRIGRVGFWLLWSLRAAVRALRGRAAEASVERALAEYWMLTRRLRYSTDRLRRQVGWSPVLTLEDACEEWKAGS